MSEALKKGTRIEARLALLSYNIDKENAHIDIKDLEICRKCPSKWCVHSCPAGVYQYAEDGAITWNYENCVECGACQYICPFLNIDCDPTLKRGGFGAQYSYG